MEVRLYDSSVDDVKVEDSKDTRATACLTSAFVEDPLFLALVGSGENYEKWAPWNFRYYLWMFEVCGLTNVLTFENEIKAVAVWEPPATTALNLRMLPRLLRYFAAVLFTSGAKYAWRIGGMMVTLEDKKAKLAPKAHHLVMLGTHGNFQGKGAGSEILKGTLARADAERFDCYVESSNPKNLPFYERQGFVTVDAVYPFEDWPEFKDTKGPVVTLMIRKPKGSSTDETKDASSS